MSGDDSWHAGTQGAAQAGTWAVMAVGSVKLILGPFLGMGVANSGN